MQNKDGSLGSRATRRDLIDCYAGSAIRSLAYLSEVKDDRWDFYQYLLYQDIRIAAKHARKALWQSHLK